MWLHVEIESFIILIHGLEFKIKLSEAGNPLHMPIKISGFFF